MLQTIDTADQFKRCWDGIHNFVMAGQCVPFSMRMPPLEDIIDVLRHDEVTNVMPGPMDVFDHIEPTDTKAQFAAMPLEQAMQRSFRISHFDLRRFDHPGGLLEGLEDQVMRPWRAFLCDNGFTLTEFFKPYFFITGPHCVTEYHMDFSHVLAWQHYGEKTFCSLKDPHRFAGDTVRREQTVKNHTAHNQPVPAGITDDDVVECVMTPDGPNAVLWNVLQTPHWVKAGPDIALSLNISHRGLRLDGQLCPHERQIESWLAELGRPSFATDY